MIDLPHTRLSLLVRLKDSADADAWRTFVDVYAPAVFAFARRNGLQSADAADLTQDVCRNVATALRSFDRMTQAQALLAEHGLVTLDRHGSLRPNPAAVIERDSRSAMMLGLKALNFDVEAKQKPGRPAKG